MTFLDLNDSRPLYEQIVERMRMLIIRGVIASDEKLPSVRNMAMELSINPNTIQRAYGELERQGYIYTVKGKGNFAAKREALLDRYKEELLTQICAACSEAFRIGVTKDELSSVITHCALECDKPEMSACGHTRPLTDANAYHLQQKGEQ